MNLVIPFTRKWFRKLKEDAQKQAEDELAKAQALVAMANDDLEGHEKQMLSKPCPFRGASLGMNLCTPTCVHFRKGFISDFYGQPMVEYSRCKLWR